MKMRFPICALIFFLAVIIAGNAASGSDFDKKFSLRFGTGARQPTLNNTFQPWVISPAFAGSVGLGISEETFLLLEYEYSKIYNDSVSTKTFKIGKELANQFWRNSSLKLKIKQNLVGNSAFVPFVSGGIGFSVWSINGVYTGALKVSTADDRMVNYAATEMILTASAGYEWLVRDNFSLDLEAQFNYLTGLGENFSKATNEIRSRAYGDIKFGATIYFNLEKGSATVSYERGEKPPQFNLVMADSDMDGIPDAIDDCPNTPEAGRNMVDERGCLLDSDGDGIPDYLDKCPRVYSELFQDSSGCPPDEDGDLVPNNSDECLGTPAGYPVDKKGCPLMDSIFARQTVYVRFEESGRGIDFESIGFLDKLAAKLLDFPNVRAIIRGYTDNQLTSEESQSLAGREASQIRNYLITRKIPEDRITVLGMGATNFIDSNATVEGRARNHRIEIEFDY